MKVHLRLMRVCMTCHFAGVTGWLGSARRLGWEVASAGTGCLIGSVAWGGGPARISSEVTGAGV